MLKNKSTLDCTEDSDSRQLPAATEQALCSLRRHLERTEQFTLVFVISSEASTARIAQRRLQAVLSSRGPFETVTIDSAEAFPECIARLADALESNEDLTCKRTPLWISLDGDPSDPTVLRRRGAVLAMLNQHRTHLERTFRRPLLIALPLSYLPRVWEVAPDLWTVRGAVAMFQDG